MNNRLRTAAHLINAGLAQSKRRSGFPWWLTSLLFGPLCTLLIVALEPVKPSVADGRARKVQRRLWIVGP